MIINKNISMNDDLLNNAEDMMLPDFLPEGSLTSDIFHLKTPFVEPVYSYLPAVNFRLEHLSLETST